MTTLTQEITKLLESALAPEYSVDDLISSFYVVLEKFGYTSLVVDAVLFEAGYAINITDEDGDSVIIYCECIEGESLIYVLGDEDIVIDITPMDPSITDERNGYIDPSFSWINKSVLDAILQAGQVDEAEMYILKGGSKIKLPVVYVNDDDYAETISDIIDQLQLVKPDWFSED